MNAAKPKIPPLLILIVSVLYFVAAISAIVFVGEVGIIGTVLEVAIFLALGIGLWKLMRWARYAEIVICCAQLICVAALLAIVLFLPPEADSITKHADISFFLLMGGIAFLHAIVLRYLFTREAKELFR